MTSNILLIIQLGLLLFPIRLLAADYYVSPSGNDNNPGSKAQPFRTIQYAVDRTAPGDVVYVEDGTYREAVVITRSGSPGAYITLKSVNRWGARVEIPTTGKVDGIKIAADYIIVDGFEIYDPNLSTQDTGNGITVYKNYYIKILNNKIHNFGGSGIQLVHFDQALIENNITYGNAKYNPNQSSGISLFQARAIDNAPGYHIIVRNNRSYGNINLFPVNNDIGTTDGNGILIDDFHNWSADDYGIYPHRTLVENNLSYDNGGKGIQVYRSDYVDLYNNTAYHNNHDQQHLGTWRAELSLVYSKNTVWRNNIGVSKPGPGVLSTNKAILIAESEVTTWENNITFSGTPGDNSIHLTNTSVTEADLANNMLGTDPTFMSSQNQDFSLKLGSPAINAGSNNIVSFFDINYKPRTSGSVDIGAYEFDENNLPVELISFEATASASDVTFSWETASELNNAGFHLEMQRQNQPFVPVAFIEGQGTIESTAAYSYTLTDLAPDSYSFRLKQVDFDGSFAYSHTVTVSVAPDSYSLGQSYPNPFNPQTRIEYIVPVSSHVRLDVYDLLGRTIQTLVDGPQLPGSYSVLFDANDLPNGTYVYRMKAGSFEETKTMVLLR